MKSLRLSNVSVCFGRRLRSGSVQALKQVELEVGGGEVVMLVGPNGAGKSTLIKVLLGLVRPQSGALEIDGSANPHITRATDRGFRSRIGYLPEAIAFSDNLTGRQVLRFFARARGLTTKRMDECLERVGLAHAANRAVRGYSRGMRQRLGLAQAILSEPDLLILDEPTGGLDQEGLSVLWSVLREWQEKGRMVLLSAHDLALLERRVTKMVVLRAGQVIAVGPPAVLRTQAKVPQRVHFEIAEHANGELKRFAEAIEELGVPVVTEDHVLLAEVAPDGLLALMDVRARFRDSVVGVRVEEVPLDLVYERLLEEC